LLNQRLDEALK